MCGFLVTLRIYKSNINKVLTIPLFFFPLVSVRFVNNVILNALQAMLPCQGIFSTVTKHALPEFCMTQNWDLFGSNDKAIWDFSLPKKISVKPHLKADHPVLLDQ